MLNQEQLEKFAGRVFDYLQGKIAKHVEVYLEFEWKPNEQYCAMQDFNTIYFNSAVVMADYNKVTDKCIKAQTIIILIHELHHVEQCMINTITGELIPPEYIEDACNGVTAKWIQDHCTELECDLHVKTLHSRLMTFVKKNIKKYDDPFTADAVYYNTNTMNSVWYMMCSLTNEWNIDIPEAINIEEKFNKYELFKQIWCNPRTRIQFHGIKIYKDGSPSNSCSVYLKDQGKAMKLNNFMIYFNTCYKYTIMDRITNGGVGLQSICNYPGDYIFTAINYFGEGN